jgi:subtilisin family serine protease
MKKVTKSLGTLTLSTGLLLSSFVQPPVTQVVSAKTTTQIDQVLVNLTPEQRQALKQLQTSDQEGLQLSPHTNLESDETISVIVEFKDKPAKTAVAEAAAKGKNLSLKDAQQKADAAHEAFKTDLQEIYKEDVKKKRDFYKVKRSYKNSFNGVAIELPGNKVKALLQSKAVKAIWSNEEVRVEPPIEQDNSTIDNKETGRLTFPGVDKLHAEGITGKGIKVGVLDTGIDYNHPDLKDVYKGGYDFVDNDSNPMETSYEDWKKSGYAERDFFGNFYYTEHGTHVSGIIAGTGKNSTDHAVTGVAPESDLYVYRVLGPYGSGYTEDILAAIDQAVVDDLDIINLSLGASYNNPMYVTSIALNNAVLAGVTAVVSAGNSGDRMYTLGSPGTAALAITVGASDTSESIVTAKGTLHTDTNFSADLKLLGKGYEDKLEELKGQNIPIEYVGYGYASDYNNKDVNGKVVLIARGQIGLTEKITTAYKNGAKSVLLFNNIPGEGFIPTYLGDGYHFIPTFNLSYEQGIELQKKVLAGTATFSFDEMGQETTDGNKLANFSSRGPARTTYDIKPEVIAPGVTVFSTVPSYLHGADQIGKYEYAYERLSGTPMASPNTAGAAALLLQSNPYLSPSQIKEILMNTADPLNGDYSVYEVGAGVVDPYEAVHSQTRIEVVDETTQPVDGREKLKTVNDPSGAISFGSIAPNGQDVTNERSVVLYNNNKESKTFDVKVQFQKDRNGSRDAATNGVKLTTDSTVNVNGNAQKKMKVSISVPKTAELGTYEGYIVYTSKNNPEETYQVPFAIRTVEEGINSFKVTPQAFTHVFDYAYSGMITGGDGIFNLKSHMKTLDLFLIDGKTNKEIGFIGTIDGFSTSLTNVDLTLKRAFDGTYFPLTGTPEQPIAYHPELAQPGFYKVRLVGTNDASKTFSQEAPVYFEHSAPKFSIDMKSDVYEYRPEEKTIKLTGSIFDKEIEDMKSEGLNFTQGNNKMYYQDRLGGRAVQIPVNQDGKFSVDIPMNQTRPMHLSFYGIDAAFNRTFKEGRDIYFIREGEPFTFAQPAKRAAYMGETLDVNLSLNNVKNVKEAIYTFDYKSDLVEIVDVKPHPSLSHKIKVIVEDINENWTTKKKITVSLKEGQTALSGNLSLVDVTYKVKDKYYTGSISPQRLITSITDIEGNTKEISFNGTPNFYMIPTYSLARGFINAEALMINFGIPDWEQPNWSLDYTKIGAEAKVTGADRKVYNGIQKENPQYEFQLPLTDEQFALKFHVPGHFTLYKTFKIGFYEDGKIINQNKVIPSKPLTAGDVNIDDVIDVMDAVYIQEKWGTNDRNADINFDGKVDALDMGFVKKNYLMRNSSAESPQKTKMTYKGKTLERIIQELGI